MSGSGLQRGSKEWLMAMRVYYANDPDVVYMIQEYVDAKTRAENYERIFNEEKQHGIDDGTEKDNGPKAPGDVH